MVVQQIVIIQYNHNYKYHYQPNMKLRCDAGTNVLISKSDWRRIDPIEPCKVDLTNTAHKSPVGHHTPTFPLPASNYRTAPPSYGQPSST